MPGMLVKVRCPLCRFSHSINYWDRISPTLKVEMAMYVVTGAGKCAIQNEKRELDGTGDDPYAVRARAMLREKIVLVVSSLGGDVVWRDHRDQS